MIQHKIVFSKKRKKRRSTVVNISLRKTELKKGARLAFEDVILYRIAADRVVLRRQHILRFAVRVRNVRRSRKFSRSDVRNDTWLRHERGRVVVRRIVRPTENNIKYSGIEQTNNKLKIY